MNRMDIYSISWNQGFCSMIVCDVSFMVRSENLELVAYLITSLKVLSGVILFDFADDGIGIKFI